jgi:hypothetical protein
LSEDATHKADEVVLGPENPYFDFSATLRIFGDVPDLDAISRELNLRPTCTLKRGDRHFKHDMWAYTAPVPEERPLHIHIQTLWRHLKPHKNFLLQMKERCTVDVFCSYRSNSRTAGFEVPAEALSMFVELNIPFGVSVIIID